MLFFDKRAFIVVFSFSGVIIYTYRPIDPVAFFVAAFYRATLLDNAPMRNDDCRLAIDVLSDHITQFCYIIEMKMY